MHLRGRSNYGDSVEDEWLIVFILKELTKRFPELWVKVVDTDGEFLLIEAANALPLWLNPEIADNRVGIVHQITHKEILTCSGLDSWRSTSNHSPQRRPSILPSPQNDSSLPISHPRRGTSNTDLNPRNSHTLVPDRSRSFLPSPKLPISDFSLVTQRYSHNS